MKIENWRYSNWRPSFRALVLALGLCWSSWQVLWAEESMRRCMILPILDGPGGGLGFKVFEEVELYLKESSLCYYRPNSEIINILQNYHTNLKSHLNNKEVIKLIAKKGKVGSLIKINLDLQPKGVDVSLVIYGDNGEDIYFNEKMLVQSDDVKLLSQTIKNWLEEYDKTIPYQGRVLGILGNQFTIDIGKQSKIAVGDHLIVRRPVRKRKHPLLKEIVEWETEPLAKATIISLSDNQAVAKMTEYKNSVKLKLDDWVTVDKSMPNPQLGHDENFPKEDNEYEFGKIGTLDLHIFAGQGQSHNRFLGQNRKIKGLLLGLGGALEVWGTRNIWGMVQLDKKMGQYSPELGQSSQSSYSINTTVLKAALGYKYLPLGFFYGPQIDGYLGYGRYSYDLEAVNQEGFGQASFSGLLLGLKGSAPLIKSLRLLLKMDFLLNPTYGEESALFGESNSTSTYQLEFGATYAYSPQMSIDALVQMTSSRAKFSSTNELSFKDTCLRSGVTFTF